MHATIFKMIPSVKKKKIMKHLSVFLTLSLFCMFLNAQTGFNFHTYKSFVKDNQQLTTEQFKQQHPVNSSYFTGEGDIAIENIDFGKQIANHFRFTEDEKALLKRNHFFVTERLSYNRMESALSEIYHADLPAFVSTDAILHALHSSYDELLISLEKGILEPNIQDMLAYLYESVPSLAEKYSNYKELETPLKDVDLYVAIGLSLIKDELQPSQLGNQAKLESVWEAVSAENFITAGLFSDTPRKLDFSQFKVRGHYEGDHVLEKYFRAMMWLGRTDFLLTPPPSDIPWPESDIRRMNLGAYLLQELLDLANARNLLEANDQIITFFIGESDNLTVWEYDDIIEQAGISSATDLLDQETYDRYFQLIANATAGEQKILSSIFIMNPFSTEPDTLPVSYKLMGQKFIVDSYVFSNVVYDRIIHNGKKVKRMMPNPLDAMFVLGNNDAIELLTKDLNEYPYAGALNNLRYLVDAYDDEFWNSSLYNIWLNAIRELNPAEDTTGYPYFMKTSAFRMQKLNTQLASWSQLRHDNLLYAKQSYTGGISCSYPYSYVEPYPDFYGTIKQFAEEAKLIFAEIPTESGYMSNVNTYFNHLSGTMDTLQVIAIKELANEPLTIKELEFLKTMLIQNYGVCGEPPYRGWYPKLHYNKQKLSEIDFTVVDVHTQPTDEAGNMVGKVLHTGVGKINMGFFIAPCPDDQKLTMFCGPVLSYYEKTTSNFERMADSEWEQAVLSGDAPERPNWVNSYLADGDGLSKPAEMQLPYKKGPVTHSEPLHNQLHSLRIYPNPAPDNVNIHCKIRGTEFVTIYITDTSGKIINQITNKLFQAGDYQFKWEPAGSLSGIYLCNIKVGDEDYVKKIVLQ